MTRVYQSGDALTSAGNRLVDCAAFRIAAATLYIALDQVMVHGIEHDLRYLGSGCIVKEYEFRITLKCGKKRAQLVNRESLTGHARNLGI